MAPDSVLYFAYGSNTDPERFEARVGRWRSRRPAWLDGYRLRFADQVRSEGGGGAVVDVAEEGEVAGVLFEISADQLAAMDREEFDGERDRVGVGRRVCLTVRTADGGLEAQLYTVEDDGGRCAPSARYLEHILVGLESAGHGPEVLERVRAVAARH